MTEPLEHSVSGVDSNFVYAVDHHDVLAIPRSRCAKIVRNPWTHTSSGWEYQGSYDTKSAYVIRSDLGKKPVHECVCRCLLDQVVHKQQIVSTQVTHPASMNMTSFEAE